MPPRSALGFLTTMPARLALCGSRLSTGFSIASDGPPPTRLIYGCVSPLRDVGPVWREFLTRADDFFGDLFSLTLHDKLIRRQVAERAVWAALIRVEPLGFDDVLGLSERVALVHVQTFISQAAVTRLNEGVLHRFAGPNKVELHAPPIGPLFERP